MRFLLLVVSLLSWGAFAQRQVCQDGVNCRVASLNVTPGGVTCVGYDGAWSYGFKSSAAGTYQCRFPNAKCAGTCDYVQLEQLSAGNLIRQYGVVQAPSLTAIGTLSAANGRFTNDVYGNGFQVIGPAKLATPVALPAAASFPSYFTSDTATLRPWWSRGDVWRDLQSGSHPTLDRREFSFGSAVEFLGMEWHSYTPNAIGSVTPVTFVAVDGAVGSNVVASGYNYRNLNNTTVLPSTFTLSGLVTGGAYSPRMCARVRVGTLPASYRFWVTLGSADPNGADTGTGSMLGFRLVNASGKFEATTCNASVCTYTATGATVAANTAYLLCADMREGTAANFTVDALAPSRITTNLPTQNMKPWVTATPIGGLASSIGIESVTVETK